MVSHLGIEPRTRRRHCQLGGSSRSTTPFATCSPLDDISSVPAISDFCARVRSLSGTPSQRPDDFGVEILPNVAVDVNLTAPSVHLARATSATRVRPERRRASVMAIRGLKIHRRYWRNARIA